jgi:hypothetical protein
VSVFESGRNKFWFYILLMYLGYRTIQLWCCVSFFGSGGKYLVGKKKSSHLSGRCAIVIMTGKKKFKLSVWQVRDRYYDRKKSSGRDF